MERDYLTGAEDLWVRAEKATKFESRYQVFPFREGQRLIEEFRNFGESIKISDAVETVDDVFMGELRRRLLGEALALEHYIYGHYYTFDDVISLYGIDREDIDTLKDWLVVNKEETLEAVDRVFRATDVEHYQLPIPMDIPRYRRQAEEYAATNIENYHRSIATLFSNLTQSGSFLRDITSVPTTEGRSYFDMYRRILALSIPDICYMTENQNLHINERELIRLFGHEGMGHGLQKIITDTSDLPPFLKRVSWASRATTESIGQFYENIIFDEIMQSPRTRQELQIDHKFDQIYREHQDNQLIAEYQRKLFQYAISVLSDKSLGDMSELDARKSSIRKRIEILSEVALHPGYAMSFIESNQHNFDSEGNLNPSLVGEMVYTARPVKRALKEMDLKGYKYEGDNRSKIDLLILSGFWTPIGLVERAKIEPKLS